MGLAATYHRTIPVEVAAFRRLAAAIPLDVRLDASTCRLSKLVLIKNSQRIVALNTSAGIAGAVVRAW